MHSNIAKRSPLFYVGDKYKLMPQLLELFPPNINNFYDVFCGGGSVALNTDALSYHMNDLDANIISLHKMLRYESNHKIVFVEELKKLSLSYGLSISEDYKYDEIEKLKKIHKKTYFSHYNKNSYLNLRDDYNKNCRDVKKLYLLLVYGFNHMIRFNKSGKFNLPVGNVDWNKNVTRSLFQYLDWVGSNNVSFSNLDFEKFTESKDFNNNDFLYFDPPYLITFSEYNKMWSKKDEIRLYNLLDKLNDKGIKWGLSNMLQHKLEKNYILEEWAAKYNIYTIESNYISRFDNSIKKDSIELYVTNFNI